MCRFVFIVKKSWNFVFTDFFSSNFSFRTKRLYLSKKAECLTIEQVCVVISFRAVYLCDCSGQAKSLVMMHSPSVSIYPCAYVHVCVSVSCDAG